MASSSSHSSAAGGAESDSRFDAVPNTIFVKIDRLRRLYRADEYIYTVRRGEDGTFGLGLSEDNEIINFYHEENTGVLRLGDQVRGVSQSGCDPVPLVRERLAALLQRHFASSETVELHITRSSEPPTKRKFDGEVFGALQLRTSDGTDLEEWISELWALRSDSTWGTFWTCPILPDSRTVWLGIHQSKLFTEPLIGCLELPLDKLSNDVLDTRWYSLVAEETAPWQVCQLPKYVAHRLRASLHALARLKHALSTRTFNLAVAHAGLDRE